MTFCNVVKLQVHKNEKPTSYIISKHCETPNINQTIGRDSFWSIFGFNAMGFSNKTFSSSYRHSLIYAVNVGTHKKRGKLKPHKLRLLSSTKGEENRIEL